MSGPPAMTLEWLFKALNIAAWIVAGLAFYFTSQTDTAVGTAKVNERVSVLEQQIHQEVMGYNVLQSSIGSRLDRIERKVDCLVDRRLCN
jgi:hypothetical protein